MAFEMILLELGLCFEKLKSVRL